MCNCDRCSELQNLQNESTVVKLSANSKHIRDRERYKGNGCCTSLTSPVDGRNILIRISGDSDISFYPLPERFHAFGKLALVELANEPKKMMALHLVPVGVL